MGIYKLSTTIWQLMESIGISVLIIADLTYFLDFDRIEKGYKKKWQNLWNGLLVGLMITLVGCILNFKTALNV
jgi:uncharacterized YccA/Bax inhibitor family protein